MAEPSEAARLRRLFEGMTGQALDNLDLDAMRSVMREAGLPVDEPTQVAELERRWQELEPAILRAAVDPEVDAFLVVDPVFQAAMERLGPRATNPDAFADESPRVRAIVTTRIVDGVVANGGWITLLTGGSRDIVPLAIEGYRLMGLEEHAALAARALAHGYVPPDQDHDDGDDSVESRFWDDVEAAWSRLPSPEAARAAFIGEHPDIR